MGEVMPFKSIVPRVAKQVTMVVGQPVAMDDLLCQCRTETDEDKRKDVSSSCCINSFLKLCVPSSYVSEKSTRCKIETQQLYKAITARIETALLDLEAQTPPNKPQKVPPRYRTVRTSETSTTGTTQNSESEFEGESSANSAGPRAHGNSDALSLVASTRLIDSETEPTST